MPQRILLIRHGSIEDSEVVLWGRTPGVTLSRAGHAEIACLAEWLLRAGVRTITSSPQLRALESAAALARALGAAVRTDPDADEFDFGDWTGRRFDELQGDAAWQRFNGSRSTASAPHGESMASLRARVRRLIDGRMPGVTPTCIVTHAEVIRTLILDSLDLGLDAWPHVPVAAASLTVMQGLRMPLRVIAVNLRAQDLAFEGHAVVRARHDEMLGGETPLVPAPAPLAPRPPSGR